MTLLYELPALRVSSTGWQHQRSLCVTLKNPGHSIIPSCQMFKNIALISKKKWSCLISSLRCCRNSKKDCFIYLKYAFIKTGTNLFEKTIGCDLLKTPVIPTQLLLKQGFLHTSKSALLRFFCYYYFNVDSVPAGTAWKLKQWDTYFDNSYKTTNSRL